MALGLDTDTALSCARRYGTRVEALYEILSDEPELANRIDPALPFCRAELVHAARNEMARTLYDVLRRRVPLLLLTNLEDEAIADAADRIGAELGWSASRRETEIATVVASRWSLPS